jgi:hypothetical protein
VCVDPEEPRRARPLTLGKQLQQRPNEWGRRRSGPAYGVADPDNLVNESAGKAT